MIEESSFYPPKTNDSHKRMKRKRFLRQYVHQVNMRCETPLHLIWWNQLNLCWLILSAASHSLLTAPSWHYSLAAKFDNFQMSVDNHACRMTELVFESEIMSRRQLSCPKGFHSGITIIPELWCEKDVFMSSFLLVFFNSTQVSQSNWHWQKYNNTHAKIHYPRHKMTE